VRAPILEGEPRAGDEVSDGRRHEHLAWLRVRGDSGTRVHRDPGHLPVDELALSGVQADAHVEPELAHGLGDRTSALDRPGRTVEGCEETVAGRIHFLAAEPDQLPAHQLVVAQQKLSPGPVAERRRPLGRADDVGEKDGGQHPVELELGMRPRDHVAEEALQLGEERLLLAK
jgi:hypothetical protein